MVVVYLTNGFGNNIFQCVAGKLLSIYHNQDLVVIPPSDDYYANSDLKSLNIELSNDVDFKNCVDVNDFNYLTFILEQVTDYYIKMSLTVNQRLKVI